MVLVVGGGMSSTLVEGSPRPRAEVLLAAAERAVDRARRLQEVTSALVAATTPDEVAGVLATQGREALDASAGIVWLLDASGSCLQLDGGALSGEAQDGLLERFGVVPVDAELPIAFAVRERQAVWLESRADVTHRFPALARLLPPRDPYAGCALPLLGACGGLGAAVFRFDRSRAFDADERAFLETLCGLAAQALERARLHEALRRSEERYRLAARALHEVVWEYVPDVGTRLWSEGPAFGYASLDAVDPHTWWLERLHPDDAPRVVSSYDAFVAGEVDTWVEAYRFRCEGGAYAHVVDRASALRADGRLRRIVGAMLDVTASRSADERLRELLNGLPGTVVWERDLGTLQVTFLSDSVREVLGYDPRRWREDDAFWLGHVHPDDRERVIGTIRGHVGVGVDLEVEYRMLTADHRWAWVRERVRCVRDAEGQVVRLRGYMVEITALKRAEEQRALAQRRLALLADASRTLAWSLERRATLATVAHLPVPELAEWCGVYLADDEGGARLSAAAHAAPRVDVLARFWRADRTLRADPSRGVRRVVASGYPERGLLRGERDEAVSYLIVPMAARGRIVGAMTLLSDAGPYDGQDAAFAEELAARAALAIDNAQLFGALAAERSRLEALVQASPVSIVLLDRDGTVRLWNPAAERVFGWNADEVVGRAFPAIPDAQRADLDAALRRVFSGEPVLDLQTFGRDKRGALLEVTVWAAAVPGPSGRPQCLAVVADVSRTRALERELRARADELAERDRRKDEFLSMLGHELRNPLAPLLAAVELLGRRDDDAALAASVRPALERQARHMARLVDDLLDVARITRGTISLRPEVVDLSTAVERALESVAPLVAERGHHVRRSLAPGVEVMADPVRLEQVLVNLLTNAARYMDPGGEIVARTELRDGEAVLSVRDRGAGIPADLLPRIFDAFTQGARDLHRHEGGLGLGLTVVRRLVELHGGQVVASSDGPGAGSEFVVTLPRASAPAPDAPAPPPLVKAQGRPRQRRRHKVLLVDDNTDALEIVGAVLTDAGHAVRMAADGHAAVDAIRREPPDAVLLDLGLPGLDGFEVARWIRERSGHRPLLVALTGYGDATHRRRSTEAGFDHHLVKPVDFAALHALLDG